MEFVVQYCLRPCQAKAVAYVLGSVSVYGSLSVFVAHFFASGSLADNFFSWNQLSMNFRKTHLNVSDRCKD